jgi:EAL domain-containing protein (putative c-di-GMP-specific phosphodiesterase class I)
MNLATSMNMEIVAEGIETEEQQNYPSLEKCQYFQGYLFSKPLTYKDLMNYLKG